METAIKLVVRRQSARGQAGSGHHEPAALGADQWDEPFAYLKDVLNRLPTHPAASRIDDLLPHRWKPA